MFEVEPLNESEQQIHDLAVARGERYHVAEAEVLASICDVDRTGLFRKFGFQYITTYCEKYMGLSSEVAGTFVRIARKSAVVPELKEAFDSGTVTLTKAKVIASVLTPENQSEWIDKAQNLSKRDLEKEVVAHSPMAEKPEKAKPVARDRVRFEFELPHEQADLFRRAQDIVSQSQGKSANLAETQVELLKTFLFHKDPVKKAERAAARKAKGTDPAPQKPESIETDCPRGRSTKRETIPAEEIHKANLRDKGACQALMPDGSRCGQTRWVQHHHIIPVSEGGANTADNLTTLCSAHHRMWHARHLRSPQLEYRVQ